MSYFVSESRTIAATTVDSEYETKTMNGAVYGVRFTQGSVQLDSTNVIKVFRGATSEPVLLKFAPTTVAVVEYLPRSKYHTSTGAVLSPSTAQFTEGVKHGLANEYLRATVAMTSATTTPGEARSQTGTLEFLIQGAG